MNRYYDENRPRAEIPRTFQPSKALAAGFIAAAILIVVPRGSPWGGLAFSEPVVMGRHFPGIPLGLIWLTQLGLGVVYGFIICRIVATYRIRRALVTAALAGLVLYVVNLAVVSLIWKTASQYEVSVIVTHLVFALITAGAYRGLLRRRIVA
jgi:hypothetical protein